MGYPSERKDYSGVKSSNSTCVAMRIEHGGMGFLLWRGMLPENYTSRVEQRCGLVVSKKKKKIEKTHSEDHIL